MTPSDLPSAERDRPASMAPTDRRTLWTILQERVAQAPDRHAFSFAGPDGVVHARWDHTELHARAVAIADEIVERFGDSDDAPRLLLPAIDGAAFTAGVMGCLGAGAIGVPIPVAPGDGDGPAAERLRAVAKDAGAVGILVPEKFAGQSSQLGLELPEIVVPRERPAMPSAPRLGHWSPELAVLQYTSGSTGIPKGVQVGHDNLLATAQDIDDDWHVDEDSLQVCWLPLFHDLGLVCGVATPLFTGMPCVLMPPEGFARNPLVWLKAMSDHRATHAAAPNFAYELAARRISPADCAGLDLSRWRVALNAAETVRITTLQKFADAFRCCGFDIAAFSPGYGLAESTAKVTAVECGKGPTTLLVDAIALDEGTAKPMSPGRPYRVLTRCGPGGARTDMRIVDPETHEELPRRRVGEVWISSPSVTRGYYGRAELTAEKFGAHTANGDGPFMRTGDLCFMDGDGELVFVTRIADRIVLRGRNLDPGAIEDACERANPRVRRGRGAAVTIERDDSEYLAVVYEFPEDAGGDEVRDCLRELRRAIVAVTDLEPAMLVLAKPGSLPRTTSGKVRRRTTAERIDALAEESGRVWYSAELRPREVEIAAAKLNDLKPMVVELLARELGEQPRERDLELPFRDLGLDSLAAQRFAVELASRLGTELPATATFDRPTAMGLAEFLSRAAAKQQTSPRQQIKRPLERAEVAVTGIACRFPGADSLEGLWRLLLDARCSISEVAGARRWPAELTNDLPAGARHAGLLSDPARFDADFFAISPREARLMDPQHRLLLEAAWSALEDACLDPTELAGSGTGVFVGISTNDQLRHFLDAGESLDLHLATGTTHSVSAGRIAYVLDLRGPTLSMDAACASGLVALHQARRAIENGECERAIVGAVHVMADPNWSTAFARSGMLDADGRCRTFDASAGGYVRAEGVAALVLERADLARERKREAYGLAIGSGVAQDGRSNGIAAPTVEGQERAIRLALADAELEPHEVDYLEAHGTATPLGDPVELEALARTYGEDRELPLLVGSIKTNLGHAESAAGAAGAIKALLALSRRTIPAHLHLEKLNPRASAAARRIDVPLEARTWPTSSRPVAAVSSFGFNGTTAHALFAAPDPLGDDPRRTNDDDAVAIVLSAKSPNALRSMASSTARRIEDPSTHLADLALGSRVGRTHHEHRLVLVGSGREHLAGLLDGFAARGEPGALLTTPDAPDALVAQARPYLLGGTVGQLPSDDERGARLAPLPPYPFEGERFEQSFAQAPRHEQASVELGPLTAGNLDTTVLSALSEVHGAAPDRYARDQRLGDDLGFDSLMTVDLERALRRRLPSLKEGEALFDEGTTVEQLLDFVSAHLESQPTSTATSESAHKAPVPMKSSDLPKQSWDHYADLIGGDPQETYVGGMYRFERHELRDLVADGDELTAVLDVENKYAGTAQFHLTQMAAYAFVAQMVHGSLCYMHDTGKDGLGMPKLARIDMHWHKLIRVSRDVPGKITHTNRRILDDGRHELHVKFDVGDGGMTGDLVGLIPIEPALVPLEDRTRQTFATLADLYRKDPKATYTGGTFEREVQTIRDVEVEGRQIRAFVDVDNAFSGTPAFHLTQMGSYSCTVQLLIGYLCARYGVDRSKMGMPVLHHYGIEWREMVPFDRNIEFVLKEVACEDDKGRDKMTFEFTVGGDHGKGMISGLVPRPTE